MRKPRGPTNYDAPAVVYLVTNTINGKRYIGVTSKRLAVRLSEHFSGAFTNVHSGHFYRAIRKYGREVFVITELMKCSSKEQALADEVRMIFELNPEYNSTKGGDGQLGRVVSQEFRAKMSAIHKGNTYNVGKKRSEETKLKLKGLATSNEAKLRWKKFSNLGPKASSKRVICLDDGRIYPSASAAAAELGLAKSALIELCNGNKRRKTVGGKKFSYMEARQ